MSESRNGAFWTPPQGAFPPKLEDCTYSTWVKPRDSARLPEGREHLSFFVFIHLLELQMLIRERTKMGYDRKHLI